MPQTALVAVHNTPKKGVSSQRCQQAGCFKQATYGPPGTTNRVFCSSHKSEGMQDNKNKMCIHEGCETRASFNYEGETALLYCGPHKLDKMININKKGRTSGQGTSAAGATGANNSAAAPAPIPPPAALVMPTMIGKGKSPKADDDVAGKELIVSPRPFRRPTASTLQIVETTDADVVELEHQLQRLSSDERKKNEEKIKAGPVDMTVRGWSQGRSGASNSGAIVSLSRTSSVSSPFQAWEWQEAGPSNGQQPAQQGDNIIPQAQLVPYLPPQDNEEELEEDGDDDVKPAAYMR